MKPRVRQIRSTTPFSVKAAEGVHRSLKCARNRWIELMKWTDNAAPATDGGGPPWSILLETDPPTLPFITSCDECIGLLGNYTSSPSASRAALKWRPHDDVSAKWNEQTNFSATHRFAARGIEKETSTTGADRLQFNPFELISQFQGWGGEASDRISPGSRWHGSTQPCVHVADLPTRSKKKKWPTRAVDANVNTSILLNLRQRWTEVKPGVAVGSTHRWNEDFFEGIRWTCTIVAV